MKPSKNLAKKFHSKRLLHVIRVRPPEIREELPMLLYIGWKPSLSTCLEIQIGFFGYIFPVCMSFIILDAISLDRYIHLMHNRLYKRVVTNKSLAVTIILAILVSSTWSILINRDLEISKVAKVFIAMSTYTGGLLATGVILNIALLRNIKKTSQNLSIHQTLDSTLTKTITIILAAQVVAYLPVLVILNIAAYMLHNSTGNEVASKGQSFPLDNNTTSDKRSGKFINLFHKKQSHETLLLQVIYLWMQENRFGKRSISSSSKYMP